MNSAKPLDKLFQLIQQLTRAEKRNYSIYAQQNTSQTDKPQHLLVFEVINKNKITDYPTLAQYFKRHHAIYRRLSQVKKYLYNDLLDFLVFSQRKSLFQDTYSLLRNKVLLQRGMKEVVIKNCKREISHLEDSRNYLLNIEYTSLLLKSMQQPYGTKEITGSILDLNRQRANYSSIVSEYYQYVYLQFECAKLVDEHAHAGWEKNQTLLDEIKLKGRYLLAKHPLLKLDLKQKNPNIKFVYLNCLFLLFSLLNRYEEALVFFKKQYNEITTSYPKDKDKDKMVSWISGHLATLYTHIDDFKNFKYFIQLYKHHHNQHDQPRANFHYFYFSQYLNYAIQKQRYNLILDIDAELKKYLAISKNLHSEPIGNLFCLYCSCFFGLQDYEKANEIASMYFLTVRPSGHEKYYTAFKLMYCMILITRQNYSLAKSECRSLLYTKRVKTNNLGYPIFEGIIKILRGLIENLMNDNTTAVTKKYQELVKEIEVLKEVGFYETLFISWIKHQVKI